MSSLNFYHDEPLFGLDIGHSNLKVMQLQTEPGKKPRVLGYGAGGYPAESMANGVIVDYKAISHALYKIFTEGITGNISAKRVACTIPTSRTFSRPMRLPLMDDDQLKEAVRLEAEQYIPLHPDNLYIDYEITHQDSEGVDVLMMAAPRNIVDSYMRLLEAIGLEPVALEPTMNATSRLFGLADPSHGAPTLLMDFGSLSVDMAAIDKTMFVNSTIAGGSDDIDNLISKGLKVSKQEAYDLKNKYGISTSKYQDAITESVRPLLENLIRECKKTVRYYNERAAANRKIVQIIIIGGGANMPGLSQYLSRELDMPARMLDPWRQLDFGELRPPSEVERSMYVTVAGEAILQPEVIFA